MSPATGHPLWKSPILWKSVMWIAIIAVVIGGTRFYAPGAEPADQAVGDENVVADPAAFAKEIYEPKVVPSITENAVDLATLLEALKADPAAAGEKYGHRNGESPYSYPVKATGAVAEGKFGEVALEVEGTGDVTVGVQTGPAVTGTSVRDATGLITFEMFLNQIDFATVATELNNQVKATVLTKTDFKALIGKHVTVIGAFTYDSPTHVKITPIMIEAGQ